MPADTCVGGCWRWRGKPSRLEGEQDAKLLKAVDLVRELLADGYRPILFCRFIPTADYVARELRQRLPKDVEVAAVTGTLPPADREARVAELTQASKRVLVCTDCLSEGINLQDYFDAVLHYDLAWNPTRHEQREGRVDRYGQPRSTVRVLTYYGSDNPIDGMVIDVLIRKHQTIRSSLGISVPVPVNTDTVARAIFESVIFRGQAPSAQTAPPGPRTACATATDRAARAVGRHCRTREAVAHHVRARVHRRHGTRRGTRAGGSPCRRGLGG